MRIQLADFFCEDRDSFKLEECFKLFLNFCQRFRTGILENEHRRQHEAAAENRRRQREEQLALKRRQSAGSISNTHTHTKGEKQRNLSLSFAFNTKTGGQQGSTGGNETDNVMDSLLLDIRNGFPMRDKVRNICLFFRWTLLSIFFLKKIYKRYAKERRPRLSRPAKMIMHLHW